jgi:hypothetical protein
MASQQQAMSSSDNLSASAANFVPGGSQPQSALSTFAELQDDEDYDEIAEALEAEMWKNDMDALVAGMDNTTVSSPVISTSLPSHLAAHAAEFWFPECRDCTCCNGYKHGCPCGGLCKCSGGTPVAAKPSSSLGAAASTGDPQHSSNTKQPCRFFQAGNCRFGDKCRFSHG